MRVVAFIFVLSVLGFPAAGYSQEFGTLFTSPEEREYLDYLRQEFLERSAQAGFDIDQDVIPDIPEDNEIVEELVYFHLGGIVTRQDGGRALWLNGKYILENELPSDKTLVRVDGITALRIVTANASYLLKPGQSVDVSTGQFWEAFEQSPNSTPGQEAAAKEESVSQSLPSAQQSSTNPIAEGISEGLDLLPVGVEDLPIPLEFPQNPIAQ